MENRERYALEVQGIVQGVGFRPYVSTLAIAHHLTGWVLNSGTGVSIEIEGTASECSAFLADLRNKVPELARIDNIDIQKIAITNEDSFVILPSRDGKRTI